MSSDLTASPAEQVSSGRALPRVGYAQVRAALLARQEIALLDVREEDPHAQAHPLFAANLPLARIEVDAYGKLPRRDVPIVTLDDGEGDAELAAHRLRALGYRDVAVFDGGVSGWRDAGGELFRDVNVPSKAFGELVEAQRHTPSLSAQEVRALIDSQADLLIVDARRGYEYRTMSLPGAQSVPGGELVLRVPDLAPDPATQVIVNCAGRTRSIIGTQSLINAGLPNPVAALRNGTIGWTLAGQSLVHGQVPTAPFPPPSASALARSARAAAELAARAGVASVSVAQAQRWLEQQGRTTYCFDVRTPEEYAAAHLPGFRNAPGGQLVQETEMFAPVRGARIILADSEGVRANMTASWLAQMNWEVHVVEPFAAAQATESGPWRAPLPPAPEVRRLAAHTLAEWLQSDTDTRVLDFGSNAGYRRAHVPGAWFILRSRLARDLDAVSPGRRYVLTCPNGVLSAFVAGELGALLAGKDVEIFVLDGGTDAWVAAGLPTESGAGRAASPAIDRYRRPYEGTDNAHAAMQAYLDWEFGLVEQLAREGTHGFRVL